MTLLSYTITKINPETSNMVVLFVFDINGSIVEDSLTLQFNNTVGYLKKEMKTVSKKLVDAEGVSRSVEVEEEVEVPASRKAFDLTEKQALDQQIRDFADAYIRGKREEQAEKPVISQEILDLVGKKSDVT